jgi:hypothetical protein
LSGVDTVRNMLSAKVPGTADPWAKAPPFGAN